MPSITVRNIPDELYAQLKASAEVHRRSINSELLVCLEKVLSSQQIDVDEVLSSARALRSQLNGFRATEEDLNQAKAEGRE